MEGKRYYIAYGSNLNKDQMGKRCPNAKAVGTAEIKDHILLFKKSKTGFYLTVEPNKGSHVPVAVWEVSKAEEAKLDRYEGCPDYYRKNEMALSVKDMGTGKESVLNAFIYALPESRPMGEPTKEYLDKCLDGYRAFGFDEKPLMDAYALSKNA